MVLQWETLRIEDTRQQVSAEAFLTTGSEYGQANGGTLMLGL